MTQNRRKPAGQGITLLEVAMLIVLMAVVLVPMARMLGGSTGSDAPTTTALNEQGLLKASASNSLIERAFSGNVLNTAVTTLNKLTTPGLPDLINPANIPLGGSASFGPYLYQVGTNDQPLYYKWNLQDLSYENQNGTLTRVSPKGNRVVRAALEMYTKDSTTGGYVSKETFNTYLYVKEPLEVQPDPYVGVSFVADVSGSMCDSIKYNFKSGTQRMTNGLCHPYLNDRFDRSDPFPGSNFNASQINLFDDRQLDVAFSLPVESPGSPYKDNFMQRDILGMPPEFTKQIYVDGTVPKSVPDAYCSLYLSSQTGGIHGNLKWLFYDAQDGNWNNGHKWQNPEYDMLYNQCKKHNFMKNEVWIKEINPYISRFEALRGAMLAFLVKMERDQELVNAMSMSLSTFSTTGQTLVPMSAPVQTIKDPETNLYRARFDEIRRRMAMFNRYDVKQKGVRSIRAIGATNTEAALLTGAKAFNGAANINSKHLIILTDGEPTTGNTNRQYLLALADAIHRNCQDASGGFPATTTGPSMPCSTNPDEWTTLNVVGFAGIPASDEKFMADLATKGGGRYLSASNVQELEQALYTLSYDIKRAMIMKRVERYNEKMASIL